MSPRRRPRNKRCWQCGVEATTKDHIVPRNLYPKRTQAQLLTLPCCDTCNQGLSKDEEYFRLVMLADWNINEVGRRVFEESVVPSLHKGFEGLRMRALSESRPISLPVGGSFVDTGLWSLDSNRLNRVAEKIVRGLYFRMSGQPMAPDMKFQFQLRPDDELRELILKTPWHPRPVVIDPEIFIARHRIARNESGQEASGWLLIFYRCVPYFVVAMSSDLQRATDLDAVPNSAPVEV